MAAKKRDLREELVAALRGQAADARAYALENAATARDSVKIQLLLAFALDGVAHRLERPDETAP